MILCVCARVRIVYMSLVLFALYWAAFSAIYALLSSHMTNKDDDNNFCKKTNLVCYLSTGWLNKLRLDFYEIWIVGSCHKTTQTSASLYLDLQGCPKSFLPQKETTQQVTSYFFTFRHNLREPQCTYSILSAASVFQSCRRDRLAPYEVPPHLSDVIFTWKLCTKQMFFFSSGLNVAAN